MSNAYVMKIDVMMGSGIEVQMERWKDGGMEGWTDSRTKKKKVYSF